MDIKPPYGYTEIVPLTTAARVRLPADTLPAVFHTMNAIPLSYAEIALASRDYPVAFVSGDGERSFLAMAILGLEAQQNLFVDEKGTWDANSYVPAYVRRYPFCMARVTAGGKEQAERIACVEKSALADDGEALYDEKGQALPAWEPTKNLLFEFEADLTRTEEMCATLQSLGLFEPFSVQAVPKGGAPLEMTGVHRVAEQKLADLSPDNLKDLMQKGVLSRVYAHILSQLNFQRLLDRRAAKLAKPAGSTLQ
ncbi:MAG TPA: SapC family protein [Burkholderiales bacterium]|nr:SapC family protein [Burkholderiales bacterium]